MKFNVHKSNLMEDCFMFTDSGKPMPAVISPLFYGEDYFRPDCFVFSINRKRSES